MPPSHDSCPCCTEELTKSVRKRIECPYCKAFACMQCQQTYLVTTVHSAHCMFCKVGWNEDFLRDSFTKTWLKSVYSVTECNQLYEREKSLMPQTQLLIERENYVNHFEDTQYLLLYHQTSRLKDLLTEIYTINERNTLDIRHLHTLIQNWNALSHTIHADFGERLDELFPPTTTGGSSSVEQKEKHRSQFIKPCPQDGCRGFLSSRWQCGLCDTKVCKDCHAINSDEHKCNLDDIATAQFISKDSKNCPKCGVSIFRIEGCSQMFCTHCHTAFDWKSLQIINGGIHNPHYFEWINRGGNANANNTNHQCGAMPESYEVASAIRNRFSTVGVNIILNFMRSVLHIHQFVNPIHNTDNEYLRIKFLRQIITEESFKQQCYTRFTKQRMQLNKNAIYDMLYNAAATIITLIPNRYNACWTDPEWIRKECKKLEETVREQINELAKYYNKSIIQFHKRYQSHAQIHGLTNLGTTHTISSYTMSDTYLKQNNIAI